MEKGEETRLKKLYGEMLEQQLIDMLSENAEDFQDKVYVLLIEEAKRRGLENKLNEIRKIKEERIRSKNETTEGFVCIFRTPYQSEIAVIKSLLDVNKIPYNIDNENVATLRAASYGVINFGVMVQKEFSEEAKELLADFISPPKIKEHSSDVFQRERSKDKASAVFNRFIPIGSLVMGVFYILFGLDLSIRTIYLYGEQKKDFISFVFYYVIFIFAAGLIFSGTAIVFNRIKIITKKK